MKSKRKKLLVSSFLLWQDPERVSLHFLTDFFIKKGFDVFWLTTPFSLFHFVKPTHLKEKGKLLNLSLKGGKEYKTGINNGTVINRAILSLVHPIDKIHFLNSYFLTENYLKFSYPSLKNLLKKYNFENPDIFMFDTNGLNGDIFQFIKPKFVIYRLNDKFSEFFQNVEKEAKGKFLFEKKSFQRADLILAVSKSLYDYAISEKKDKTNVYLLPNGVDVDRFSEKRKEPLEYQKIPKPRALYVGILSNWFDWNLIISVAKMNKKISFVIIGDGKVPKDLPKNIFILGPIAYEKMPAFMQYVDVGIIPFKNLPRMDTVERPLKFYQYLASGLPIVSTAYGKLKEGMSPYALFGNTPDEFSTALQKALSFSQVEKDKLKEAAKQFSWDRIFEKLEKILKEVNPSLLA